MLKLGFSPTPSLLLVLALGCQTREAPSDAAIADAEQGDGQLADGTRQKLPPPGGKDLGAACSAPGDCASRFCVDGVCCDTDCDSACFACNTPGAEGSCTGLNSVEDLSATPACAGSRICATDSSGGAACRLKDGEACTLLADCATGSCRTYYPDDDGDGYGADSPDTIVRCDAMPQPPQGFTATGGDCCDLDARANPGLPASSYFTTKDLCGSYDWNCRNGEEKQSSPSCPTPSGAALSCGQTCSIGFKGTSSVLFVQACH